MTKTDTPQTETFKDDRKPRFEELKPNLDIYAAKVSEPVETIKKAPPLPPEPSKPKKQTESLEAVFIPSHNRESFSRNDNGSVKQFCRYQVNGETYEVDCDETVHVEPFLADVIRRSL